MKFLPALFCALLLGMPTHVQAAEEETPKSEPSNKSTGDAHQISPSALPALALRLWQLKVEKAIMDDLKVQYYKAYGLTAPIKVGLIVKARYVLTPNAHVRNVKLITASGDPEFDQMALNAVKSVDGNAALLSFPFVESQQKDMEMFTTLASYNIPVSPDPHEFSSPGMVDQESLTWDSWHSRIEKAVWAQFNKRYYQTYRNSQPQKPLIARIKYLVTRDAHITSVELMKSSNDPGFDQVALDAVRAIDGDTELLHFPAVPAQEELERSSVQKYATLRKFPIRAE